MKGSDINNFDCQDASGAGLERSCQGGWDYKVGKEGGQQAFFLSGKEGTGFGVYCAGVGEGDGWQ